MSSLSKRNKESDFDIISKSSSSISIQLKSDESKPDLETQFRTSSSQDVGHHRYFLTPYKSPSWGQSVEHTNFVPLPAKLLDQYRNIECASFMGLIPEINR